MRTALAGSLFTVLVSSAGLLGCSSPAPPASVPISAERAQRLAVEHFNETFANLLQLKESTTGTCSALPELRLDQITATRLEEDSWVIERSALVGLAFKIRVASNGHWAAVEQLSFPVR
jgi:predicted component of type VI protein secretion system